ELAFLQGRPGGRRGGLRPKSVDLTHQQENRERQNHKVDQRVHEQAVVERRSPRGLGLRQAVEVPTRKGDEEVREIHFPQQQSDGRHQDVVDQRGYDPPKGRAHHDANRHIDHIPTHGKFFELFQHGCSSWASSLLSSSKLFDSPVSAPAPPHTSRRAGSVLAYAKRVHHSRCLRPGSWLLNPSSTQPAETYASGPQSPQSSVRKGEAGKPARLYRLQYGFMAHAYRTATGCGAFSLRTTTVSPSILASAAT